MQSELIDELELRGLVHVAITIGSSATEQVEVVWKERDVKLYIENHTFQIPLCLNFYNASKARVLMLCYLNEV